MELSVWVAVSAAFALVAALVLRWRTGRDRRWMFFATGLVPVALYLTVLPTCGCMGFDQVVGTAYIAGFVCAVVFTPVLVLSLVFWRKRQA